jgi:hypothetical protein
LIKNTPILILLLMILSLGVTLSPSKQGWAISQGTADVLGDLITTFGPMVGEYLNPKDESEGTGNPPSIESPAPLDPNDPCANPGANPGIADLCGGSQPDTLPYGSNDPCANPGIADLCGGSQLGILPYGSNAPYNPLSVMQQFWGDFERLLSYLAPEDQAALLSDFRLMIEQGLAPYPPEQQQEAIQMLQQTMSPELSGVLLPT